MDHALIPSFISAQEAHQLMGETDKVIANEATRANWDKRIAYTPDKTAARESHAFVLAYPGGYDTADLPGLPLSALPSGVAALTERVLKNVGVTAGRVLSTFSATARKARL